MPFPPFQPLERVADDPSIPDAMALPRAGIYVPPERLGRLAPDVRAEYDAFSNWLRQAGFTGADSAASRQAFYTPLISPRQRNANIDAYNQSHEDYEDAISKMDARTGLALLAAGGAAAAGGFGGAAGGSAATGGAAAPSVAAPASGLATMPTNIADVITVLGAQAAPAIGPGMAAGIGAGAGAVSGAASSVPGGRGVPNWIGNYLIPGLDTALGINAANQASDAMLGASEAAIAEGRRQYDQTRTDSMPWLLAGSEAVTGLRDPRTNFFASPQYDFVRGEGTRGIENSFAARGSGQSGNALRRLAEFNSGLASGEFNNWFGNQLNLAGLGSDTARSVGALGANNAANAGHYMLAGGDARASGVLGRNAAIGNGINTGYRNFLYNRGP